MDTIKNVLYSIWGVFKTIGLNDIIDIMILSYLFFHIMKLIRETRALQLAKGIMLLVGSYIIAVVFNLQTLKFLLKICFQWGFVALIILFQPELRRMLERVGRSKIADIALFKPSDDEQDAEHIRSAIRAVCDASMKLSSTRTGALIIFERKTKLGEQIATGTLLDCVPSAAMLGNIFVPNTPLHDGAVIIRDGKILAAGFSDGSDSLENSVDLIIGIDHLKLVGGVHLDGCEALVLTFLCGGTHVGRSVASDPGIYLHAVAAGAAHELPYWSPKELALDVPQALVDTGDGAHENSATPVESGPVDGGLDILDPHGILADQIRLIFVHTGEDRVAVSLEDSFAPAGVSFISNDLDKTPAGSYVICIYFYDFHMFQCSSD